MFRRAGYSVNDDISCGSLSWPLPSIHTSKAFLIVNFLVMATVTFLAFLSLAMRFARSMKEFDTFMYDR